MPHLRVQKARRDRGFGMPLPGQCDMCLGLGSFYPSIKQESCPSHMCLEVGRDSLSFMVG